MGPKIISSTIRPPPKALMFHFETTGLEVSVQKVWYEHAHLSLCLYAHISR